MNIDPLHTQLRPLASPLVVKVKDHPSEIPYELLVKIFSLLCLPDLSRLALSNKKFSSIFQDNHFWFDKATEAGIYDAKSSLSPLDQFKDKINLGRAVVHIQDCKIVVKEMTVPSQDCIPYAIKALKYFPKDYFIEIPGIYTAYDRAIIYYDDEKEKIETLQIIVGHVRSSISANLKASKIKINKKPIKLEKNSLA